MFRDIMGDCIYWLQKATCERFLITFSNIKNENWKLHEFKTTKMLDLFIFYGRVFSNFEHFNDYLPIKNACIHISSRYFYIELRTVYNGILCNNFKYWNQTF